MAKILIAAIALALASCTTTPAEQHIPAMKAHAVSYGLVCPVEAPLITYGNVAEASAQWPSTGYPGGIIKMPAKYADAKWSRGPHAHNRMAHEVAHTCGADERTARAVGNSWWPVEANWNGGLRD
jgi:hypothetical protein